MNRVALASLVLAGCLEVPQGAPQECSATSDCDTAHGEVCDEGVCYGNPPMGEFAATISAPSTRNDVVATELPLLSLSDNGWLGDIPLDTPVTISGRVEAYCAGANQTCSNMSIGAEVRFTRPSRFPGGPTLRLSVQAKAGLPRGTDSFSIKVPPTQPGDEPYTVTIDPEGGGEKPPTDGNAHPAELVPPKRLMLAATEDSEHQTYTLGSANPVTISGTLKDALGTSLVGYRVVALGKFDAQTVRTEVSTVDYVSNGQYSITLADNVVGQVEIVATPFDDNVVAPTLHLTTMSPTVGARPLSQPTGLGNPVDVTLFVKGQAGSGPVTPVPGARVIITGTIDPVFSDAAGAELTAEATTGDDGYATLKLLDGAALLANYKLRIVPPTGSNLGVVYNVPYSFDMYDVQLPSRVAVSGTVVDFAGNPIRDVSVTARRSLRFLWTLPPEDQAFLDEIPAATTLTPSTGIFVVWVDPSLADAWGHYDMTFETPKGSTAATWRILDLEIPRVSGQTAINLDAVTMPEAAYLHGRIVDAQGLPVEGSTLRIYEVPPPTTLCTDLAYAPDRCELDAQVAGDGESDANGIVRLDVARP